MTHTSSLSPCSFCGQTPGPGDEPFKPGVPVTFQNVELDMICIPDTDHDLEPTATLHRNREAVGSKSQDFQVGLSSQSLLGNKQPCQDVGARRLRHLVHRRLWDVP